MDRFDKKTTWKYELSTEKLINMKSVLLKQLLLIFIHLSQKPSSKIQISAETT